MERLTAKELAQKLDAREYLHEITEMQRQQAVASGLVVVFGRSDDLVELNGAIIDEADCYTGAAFLISKNGVVRHTCDNYECPFLDEYLKNCDYIEAKWNENGIPWTYETDIPHETFRIFDEEELYCIGIVFSIDDIEAGHRKVGH